MCVCHERACACMRAMNNCYFTQRVLLGTAGHLNPAVHQAPQLFQDKFITYKTSLCQVELFRAIILVAATTTCTTVRGEDFKTSVSTLTKERRTKKEAISPTPYYK